MNVIHTVRYYTMSINSNLLQQGSYSLKRYKTLYCDTRLGPKKQLNFEILSYIYRYEKSYICILHGNKL